MSGGAWCRAVRLLPALLLATLCGCAGKPLLAGKPFLSAGDANSAAVGFGGDVASASEVAKAHCASYGKVPRFLDAEDNIAYFACERR